MQAIFDGDTGHEQTFGRETAGLGSIPRRGGTWHRSCTTAQPLQRTISRRRRPGYLHDVWQQCAGRTAEIGYEVSTDPGGARPGPVAALACRTPERPMPSRARCSPTPATAATACRTTRTPIPNYSVPKLGGQNAAYLVSALNAYASGDRAAPDHALAGRHALRPGPRRHRRLSCRRGRAAEQASRRHAAAGDADLRRLPRRRRREDHRRPTTRSSPASTPTTSCTRCRTTRAASARIRSWPASSPAWTRRTSRRSREFFGQQHGAVQHRSAAQARQVRQATRADDAVRQAMSFRAFRIHQEGGKIVAAPGDDRPGRSRGRRGRRQGRLLDDQLQGRARRDRRRQDPAQVSAGRRHRSRRRSRVLAATPTFKPGQKVLVNGCGLSETHDGGYAEYARVQGDWVVPIPAGPRRIPVHGDRHRRLHRRARDPSHGAERPAARAAARSS